MSSTFTDEQHNVTEWQAIVPLVDSGGTLGVVLDGAQFESLPDQLARAEIESIPLYRDRRDGSTEWSATMPRLVIAADHEAVVTIASVVGHRPTGIVWVVEGGPDELYKHLRTLNRVRIADRRRGSDADEHEWVTFRHADADVLAQVVSALDAGRLGQLLGPASSLLFNPGPDYAARDGWHRVDRSDEVHEPGSLTFDLETLDAIEASRSRAIRRGIVRFLLENRPTDLPDLDADAARMIVERSERSARDLGLRSATARRNWAWLDLISDGRINRDPNVLATIREPGNPPEEVVESLVDMVLDLP